MAARFLLRWTDEQGAPQEFALDEGTHTIGRGPENSIVLGSTRVSRVHVRITATAITATLEDQQSRNGTMVNEEKVSTADLRDGDEISLSGIKFRVVSTEPGRTELGITATVFLDAEDMADANRTALLQAPPAAPARPAPPPPPPPGQTVIVSRPAPAANVQVAGGPARGVVPEELLRSPVVSERALQDLGVEVQVAEAVALGGGLGSFVWVDLLRNAGMSASDILVVGTETKPHARYERLCMNSQIPPHERLRSNSESCPDNLWGFPGYAVREGLSSLKRGNLFHAASVFWQIFGEPAIAQTYTPRTDQVFPSIDKEARRIDWQQMLRPGRVRAVRKSQEGRIVAICSRTDIAGGGSRQHFAVAGKAVQIAVGYPAIQLLPDLADFREKYGQYDRVVNAYEEHSAVYERLRRDGGVVLLRGRGIVASRIIQRLSEERRTQPKIQVVHLHRSRLTEGHHYKWARRRVENEFEFQPFNWPKGCWTGEYRDELVGSGPDQRKAMLDAWAGTTTANRRDWRRIVNEGLRDGWYRPEYGAVREVAPGANGRIVTRIASNLAGGGELNLEADHVIDCTGLVSSPLRSPLLADLVATFNLQLSVSGRLPVSNRFEIEAVRNGQARLYAAGAMTLGGPQAAVDSFLGLQDAALTAFDNQLELNLRGLRNLNGPYSFAQWWKWARGAKP